MAPKGMARPPKIMIDFASWRKRLAAWLLFFVLLVLPMLAALVYYTRFALDRYVSVAQVTVRQAGGGDAPQIPGLAVMIGGINPASREETLYLREYILSNDMLKVLQKELQWPQHYAKFGGDLLFYLDKDAPQEDVLEYYRRMVRPHFDEQTGLLSVQVQAFTPDFSEATLKIILAESERFVNELSHRMAREEMAFAQQELANARKEYELRQNALLQFQSSSNLLDAEAAAKSRAGIITEIESQLTKERTTLKGMQAVLGANTPQIRQQRNRVQALEQQLAAEKQRLVAQQQGGGDRLNVAAARYRSLTIDATIAEEAYKYAVSSVETARMEASKKLRSLVTVVSPNTPEMAIYPERAYNLITIFIGLLLFYGIVRFIVATIEDHRD